MILYVESIHLFIRYFNTSLIRFGDEMRLHGQTCLRLGIANVVQDHIKGAAEEVVKPAIIVSYS